jgi:hypothetical protein
MEGASRTASFAPWFAGRTDGLEPVRAEWLLVAEMGTPSDPPSIRLRTFR